MSKTEVTDAMVARFAAAWDAMPLPKEGPNRYTRQVLEAALEVLDPPSIAPTYRPGVARVVLFKRSGKYYTEEEWVIPTGAIVPAEMKRSKDFRRIDGGAVLIESQEPWGYPHLFPTED